MRKLVQLSLVVTLSALSTLTLAEPEELSLDQLDLLEESILEPKAKPAFQSQLFTFDLPPRWALTERNDTSFIFRPTDGRDATMLIRIQSIPLGTRPKHVWLQEKEHRYKRYPRFSVMGPVLEMDLNGNPSARILASYYYQGNQQYPRTIETTYLVRENEVFILELDCFTAHASRISRDASTMYQSFIARPSSNQRTRQRPVDNVPY